MNKNTLIYKALESLWEWSHRRRPVDTHIGKSAYWGHIARSGSLWIGVAVMGAAGTGSVMGGGWAVSGGHRHPQSTPSSPRSLLFLLLNTPPRDTSPILAPGNRTIATVILSVEHTHVRSVTWARAVEGEEMEPPPMENHSRGTRRNARTRAASEAHLSLWRGGSVPQRLIAYLFRRSAGSYAPVAHPRCLSTRPRSRHRPR